MQFNIIKQFFILIPQFSYCFSAAIELYLFINQFIDFDFYPRV